MPSLLKHRRFCFESNVSCCNYLWICCLSNHHIHCHLILIYHNYCHHSSYLKQILYHRTQWNQTFYTYICDYTLDPIWLEQRFVYDVPELAINEPRRFNVRVIVKARSLVGIDPVLGKTFFCRFTVFFILECICILENRHTC